MKNHSYVLVLSALVLTACGGGGGGGGGGGNPSLLRTTISGNAAPPAVTMSGPGTATATVLTPPVSTGTWPSIVQSADYVFDVAGLNAARMTFTVNSATINNPVDTVNGSITISTGAAYPTDVAVGQTTEVNAILPGRTLWLVQAPGGPIPGNLNPDEIGPGLASVALVAQPTPTTYAAAEYALPYSAALSPSGYTYQTFGTWGTIDTSTGAGSENYFSTGAPTLPASLPAGGTATYTGRTMGSYVDAATRDSVTVRAAMNATADFATRSVAFSTTGSTRVSDNAPVGTAPTAAPGMDLTGTLTYPAGSNTFTGTVTANGMSGNATGRFYGPTIKAGGAPAEIGGTFAVMGIGGTLQGAFGGK